MPFAPQQDWSAFRVLTEKSDRRHLQSLSDDQRFALYENLFEIVFRQPDSSPHSDRLEGQRWADKLALRHRLLEAYQALDRCRRG